MTDDVEWVDGIPFPSRGSVERDQREWRRQREAEERRVAELRAPARARYVEYLRSPEWAAKREAVMQRAKTRMVGGQCRHPWPICERCLARPAVEVHHLTYIRRGYEQLEDLIALCKPCHDAVHGKSARR